MSDDSVDALLRELETPPAIRWRLEQLLEADYPLELAEELANRCDVDLHQALELRSRGCTPELAAAILL